MLQFSIPTAILGSLIGSLVLFGAMAYIRSLPRAPAGIGWWATAIGLNALRLAIYLAKPLLGGTAVDFLAESVHAIEAILLLTGTLVFVGYPPRIRLILACSAATTAWSGFSTFAVPDFLLRTIPLYLLVGTAMIATGAILMHSRAAIRSKEERFTGLAFVLWGLHKLDFPFLRPVEWFAPWGFMIAQVLSTIVAVGLIFMAFRRLQDEVQATGSALERRHGEQSALNGLMRIALEDLPLEKQLEKSLDVIIAAPWLGLLPRGGIFLTEKASERLALVTQRDLPEALLSGCAEVELGHCLCGRAAATRRIQHAARIDDRRERLYEGTVPHGHYNVPIVSGDRTLGVMVLYPPEGHARSRSEALFLEAVASTLAGMIVLKQTKEALEQSEVRFRSLIEHAQDIITVLDGRGVVLFESPSVEHILGYAVDELVGRSVFDFVHPEDQTAVQTVFRDALEHPGAARRLTLRYRHKDGSWRILEAMGTSLLDDPRVRGIVINSRDISDRMRTEEQLRQSQKTEAMGQLTGGLAHDFNNLLAIIQGNAELLAEESVDAFAGLTRPMLRAARRGAELTQRLLAFSRRQPLLPRAIDLAALVDGMSGLLDRTLGETITVETAISPDLSAAWADPGQLESALLNLSINARDAMPEGGRLRIECADVRLDEQAAAGYPEVKPGDYVTLAVSDSGIGMTPEVRAQAFEPFFTTKEVGRGSGLGLSMVYGFAKQSGGHVTIDSGAGKGTTVRLYLPKSDEPPAIDEPRAGDQIMRGQGESVLVIEDDEEVRSLVVTLLKSLGYDVVDVADATAARGVLNDGRSIDLVLSDVVLANGMGGIEFAEELRASHPGVKAVLMSGYAARAAARPALPHTNLPFLRKPFHKRELAQVLRDALAS